MTTTSPVVNPGNNARIKAIMITLGVAIPVVVAILHFYSKSFHIAGAQVKFLPAVNAVLNSLTAVCLLLGFYFIRQKQVLKHRAMMGTAFVLGALFLVSYVVYHSQVDSTVFGGRD
nr:DUF420 domain-containing protein [Hymenobacter cellulosilyticus]